VNIRITPFTTSNTQSKIDQTPKPIRFINPNKSTTTKSTTTKSKLLLIPAKKQTTKLNNTFLLTNKKTMLVRPVVVADKKGVFLYQQIERDKSFLNGSELINRFHFKV